MTWELWWLSRISICLFYVDMLYLHACIITIKVRNPCGKVKHIHPCFRLHSHGKLAFTTSNVSTFKLFTFKNVELKDWNTLHIHYFCLVYQVYYFSSTFGKHKGTTITTYLCTKFVIILNLGNIIVMHAIGLLQVLIKHNDVVAA